MLLTISLAQNLSFDHIYFRRGSQNSFCDRARFPNFNEQPDPGQLPELCVSCHIRRYRCLLALGLHDSGNPEIEAIKVFIRGQ